MRVYLGPARWGIQEGGGVRGESRRACWRIRLAREHRTPAGRQGAEPGHLRQIAPFTRVHLHAGESEAVQLALEPRSCTHWDENAAALRIVGGTYTVTVGILGAGGWTKEATFPLRRLNQPDLSPS
ncbi:hypothetical protein E3T25_07310 [Cryobacterium sandaracinum]|uniref:Fibronectin type III-like domain-containing protein n=1 Tax=Cryobacterium sandaracinum TaxID=1259247 RepID=A0ABY2JGP4_9MICO|nr:hypothetical protein E3T25_07310 [Cryobacterium sandaracinum]